MSGLSEYQEEQKNEARDLESQLREHAPLVKMIAHHLISRLPSSVQLNDLIQAGMIGLMQAIQMFDASKGASFHTYASLRIRGSMIDELRQNSPFSQHALHNMHKIAQAIQALESKNQRASTSAEIAEYLGVSLEEYYKIASTSVAIDIKNIEDLNETELSDSTEEADLLSDIETEQLKKILVELIDTLGEKEKLVLSLYYNDAFTFKAISEVLEVTEARVSQIHSEALLKLRVKAKKYRQE